MQLQQAFAQALRRQRKAAGLSQEAFTNVSSRTYLSELERGLKNPTLEKIDELAETMDVHPLTLLSECFALRDNTRIEDLLDNVLEEMVSQEQD